MKMWDGLKKLYDAAEAEAERTMGKIGAEAAECFGDGTAVETDGLTAAVLLTDKRRIEEEFGTEDTLPNPHIIQDIYSLKEKICKSRREELWT